MPSSALPYAKSDATLYVKFLNDQHETPSHVFNVGGPSNTFGVPAYEYNHLLVRYKIISNNKFLRNSYGMIERATKLKSPTSDRLMVISRAQELFKEVQMRHLPESYLEYLQSLNYLIRTHRNDDDPDEAFEAGLVDAIKQYQSAIVALATSITVSVHLFNEALFNRDIISSSKEYEKKDSDLKGISFDIRKQERILAQLLINAETPDSFVSRVTSLPIEFVEITPSTFNMVPILTGPITFSTYLIIIKDVFDARENCKWTKQAYINRNTEEVILSRFRDSGLTRSAIRRPGTPASRRQLDTDDSQYSSSHGEESPSPSWTRGLSRLGKEPEYTTDIPDDLRVIIPQRRGENDLDYKSRVEKARILLAESSHPPRIGSFSSRIQSLQQSQPLPSTSVPDDAHYIPDSFLSMKARERIIQVQNLKTMNMHYDHMTRFGITNEGSTSITQNAIKPGDIFVYVGRTIYDPVYLMTFTRASRKPIFNLITGRRT